jgi:hypothetical protein
MQHHAALAELSPADWLLGYSDHSICLCARQRLFPDPKLTFSKSLYDLYTLATQVQLSRGGVLTTVRSKEQL